MTCGEGDTLGSFWLWAASEVFCQVTDQWLFGLFGLHLHFVVSLTKYDVTVRDGLGHPGRLLVLLMRRMRSLGMYFVLRSSYMPGKYLTTEPHHQHPFLSFR